jgi:hypothetical protein
LYILDHHKTFLVHLLLTDTLQTNAILSCPNLPLTFEISLFHTFVLAMLIKSVSSANVQDGVKFENIVFSVMVFYVTVVAFLVTLFY